MPSRVVPRKQVTPASMGTAVDRAKAVSAALPSVAQAKIRTCSGLDAGFLPPQVQANCWCRFLSPNLVCEESVNLPNGRTLSGLSITSQLPYHIKYIVLTYIMTSGRLEFKELETVEP